MPQRQGLGQGRFKAGGAGGGPRGFLQELSLTEDQKTKLKAIQQDGQSQSKAVREKTRGLYREMMTYMASPEAKEDKAMDMQRHIQGEQAKLGEIRMKSWFKIRSILTPEQIETINTKFQENAKRMDAMKDQAGKGGGNPAGGRFGPGGGAGGGALGERFRQRRGGNGGQMFHRPGFGGPQEGFAPPDGAEGFGPPPEGPPPEGPAGQLIDGLLHSALPPGGTGGN
jgi:Spy/CpxP family protein refolding chaperone